MLPSVTTLQLSTLPFLYTSSPPPYLFPDLSSLLCLKCTLYSVQPCIYLQFSFAYNEPTNQNNLLWLGGSKLHIIVNWDFLFLLSRALQLNKNTKYDMKCPIISHGTSLSKILIGELSRCNFENVFSLISYYRGSLAI